LKQQDSGQKKRDHAALQSGDTRRRRGEWGIGTSRAPAGKNVKKGCRGKGKGEGRSLDGGPIVVWKNETEILKLAGLGERGIVIKLPGATWDESRRKEPHNKVKKNRERGAKQKLVGKKNGATTLSELTHAHYAWRKLAGGLKRIDCSVGGEKNSRETWERRASERP